MRIPVILIREKEKQNCPNCGAKGVGKDCGHIFYDDLNGDYDCDCDMDDEEDCPCYHTWCDECQHTEVNECRRE